MEELKLDAVNSNSLADQVEHNLMKYLKSNNLKPGDALPTEIELAQTLGVSRNVVREALSRLKMLGVVESKKRKGLVITEPDLLSSMTRLLDPGLLNDETLQDVFELRLVLEAGMADLLYLRKTEADIVQLEDIAKREAQDERCAASQEVRFQYEIEFHGKLYGMTGNTTLKRFQRMLLPIFNYMRKVESHLDSKPKRSKIHHLELVETLKTGTPALFKKHMREHLNTHYSNL